MKKSEKENKPTVPETPRELTPEELDMVSGGGQPEVYPKSEESDR